MSVRARLLQGDLEARCPFLSNGRFIRAVTNVPNCDVDDVLNATSELRGIAIANVPNCGADESLNVTLQSSAMSRKDVAQLIAGMRWANRVCDRCWKKDRPKELMLCNRCCLVFYCDRGCQKADWARHKLRCCAENPVPDDGPHGLILGLPSDSEASEDFRCGEETTFHGVS